MTTPSRTGTPAQIDGSAGNGSTSVTVPADCNLIVAFASHWDGDGGSTLSALTVNGVGFTERAQQAESGGESGQYVGTLVNPATGSQTVAWTWSAGGARSEGGEIVLVFYKDGNTSDPVNAAGVDAQVGGTTPTVTLAGTASTDRVVGFTQNYIDVSSPNLTGAGTPFINNATLNSQAYDVSDTTGVSGSVNVSNSNPYYSSVGAISLKESVAGGATDLAPANAAHAHAADAPSLTQLHILALADAQHGHLADNVALGQVHVLALANADHAHAADAPSLTQQHELQAASADHAQQADTPTLTQLHLLQLENAQHGHEAEAPALTQLHVLQLADALHGEAFDNVTLAAGLTLSIDDALSAHQADNPALTQEHILQLADAVQAHFADSLALTQLHILAVSDALHEHLAQNVSIFSGLLEPGEERLLVIRAEHRALVIVPRNTLLAIARRHRTLKH